MNAGAECRVPVCRLQNHVVAPVVNRSVIFFIFFLCKKYNNARVCNIRCDKFMTSGLIDLTLQFNLPFLIPFKLQYVTKSHIKMQSAVKNRFSRVSRNTSIVLGPSRSRSTLL